MQATTQLMDSTDSSKVKRVSSSEHQIESSQEYLDLAKQLGSRALSKGSNIVRSNPGYSLLGAAAVGFIAGAFLSKKTK